MKAIRNRRSARSVWPSLIAARMVIWLLLGWVSVDLAGEHRGDGPHDSQGGEGGQDRAEDERRGQGGVVPVNGRDHQPITLSKVSAGVPGGIAPSRSQLARSPGSRTPI